MSTSHNIMSSPSQYHTRLLDLTYIFSCVILVLSLFSCSKEAQPTASSLPDRIGLAYALGGKGDQSYNDAASMGADILRAKGIAIQEFEPTGLADFASGVSALSAGKPDLVFCVGYLYDEHIEQIAKRHPDIRYVVLDGFSKGRNYSSVKFDAKSGSYLAGVLAAKMSSTGTIAFIGGTNLPIINEFRDGFEAGAKSIRPEIDLITLYVGAGSTAFTDPVAGRETALTAIGRNADVIYHAAGTSGNGVIKAASDRGVYAIGVDVDQSHLAPDVVIASMVKKFGPAMSFVVDRFSAGEDIGNRGFVLGLSEDAVDLSHFSNVVPEDVKQAVRDAKTQLLKEQTGG